MENSLLEHAVVAEAAVVGVPDEHRGERVEAYVVPREEVSDVEAVREDLKSFLKERLAWHASPRDIEFLEELPTTETGKIQRYELRERDGG